MKNTLATKAAVAVITAGLAVTGSAGLDPIAPVAPVAAESPPIPEIERGPAGVDGEITRLYVALLDRRPEEEGLEYWVERRRLGMPLTEMVAFFRTSPEFQQSFGTLVDAPTAEWVEFMYTEVLERPSEQAGKDFWVDRVESGAATKEDLIIFFADSTEFRIKTGTGLVGLLALVDSSEASYATVPEYTYQRSTHSFDFSSTTTIEVLQGEVVARSYAFTDATDPTRNVEWVEVGDEVGTNDAGAPALTIEGVHDECRALLLELDPIDHSLIVVVDDDGRMTRCGGIYRIPIADAGSGDYVEIEEFTVLGTVGG